jgi:hypothetical protein
VSANGHGPDQYELMSDTFLDEQERRHSNGS